MHVPAETSADLPRWLALRSSVFIARSVHFRCLSSINMGELTENPTFQGLALPVRVWRLDFCKLLLPRSSSTLARRLAAGTAQSRLSPFLDLRHRDTSAFHGPIIVQHPKITLRGISGQMVYFYCRGT